eukprot:gnl/MRDRNA2_/MRDRNA2_113951_c0_seq1.p1 gnl/MRDRNA2_/MRDRNA2_113951_c0~~gnl/MRDRNA2_/MRDRNA2_113951_c0_seq1.p1  ORF type:complete len:188 (+),score=23.68 gnl/MRDRNA2_/MRDRNA2_113951_c0_seq1:63-626(+)
MAPCGPSPYGCPKLPPLQPKRGSCPKSRTPVVSGSLRTRARCSGYESNVNKRMQRAIASLPPRSYFQVESPAHPSQSIESENTSHKEFNECQELHSNHCVQEDLGELPTAALQRKLHAMDSGEPSSLDFKLPQNENRSCLPSVYHRQDLSLPPLDAGPSWEVGPSIEALRERTRKLLADVKPRRHKR